MREVVERERKLVYEQDEVKRYSVVESEYIICHRKQWRCYREYVVVLFLEE